MGGELAGESSLELGTTVLTAGVGKMFSSAVTNSLIKKSIPTAVKASSPTGKYYSVAHEMTLSKNLYPGGSYYQHFKAANKSLSANMDAATMSKLNIQFHTSKSGSILWGRSPKNWVWHHDIGKGVMQLVPKTQHTSGSIFWNNLHPNGIGGMHIWNK